MSFGMWSRLDPRKQVIEMQLVPPGEYDWTVSCAAAMRPCVKLLWPLVCAATALLESLQVGLDHHPIVIAARLQATAEDVTSPLLIRCLVVKCCWSVLRLHGSLVIGSRPSDHYFRSVCLSLCLFVCAEFFSAVFDPISIKLRHMLHVQV